MTREFTFEKSTKNTHRYAEVVTTPDETVVGVIYVQKHALPVPAPQRIRVTIEEVVG